MPRLVIGTAGHVDHGKSALVRALTGIDPDRLKEEKARGITIDLGFAHALIDDVHVAFVDVPGHERFVKNMLAGVGGIDAVLLVVAADESVKPQTGEHFAICRLLQVPAGVIALTKADLADEEMLELVRLEVRELVAGSFLESAPILAVSSRSGTGLDALKAALHDLAHAAHHRSAAGVARLPIDRVFSVKGFGTVVTGTLISGQIGEEDELVAMPGSRTVKVRSLQVHGENTARAVAGQRVAANLGGVEVTELARGNTLLTPGALGATRTVDADVELLAHVAPLTHGARIRFHQGTSEILGRIAIASEIGGGPVGQLRPGTCAYVRLRLESPAVLTRGDRYILRAYSPPTTIGGGQVLDPQPPRSRLRTPAALTRFARLRIESVRGAEEPADAHDRAVAAMVEERGAAGLPLTMLVSRAGLSPAVASSVAARLDAAGVTMLVDDVLVASPLVESLKRQLLEGVQRYHRAEPLGEGLPREEARERLFARAHPAVFERVLSDLVTEGRIMARDRIALAGHRVELNEEEERARVAIERALQEAGLKPPDPRDLATISRTSPQVVERVISLLVRQRVLVRVDTLVFHGDALRRLKADIAALKASQAADTPTVDVAAFKERYGITRKFAIPLLEYLDRERVTKRIGDTRVVI